jgi:hypothetical protein
MKSLLLLLFVFTGMGVFSQSLRDSLFSGKLKADSALVAKSKAAEKKDSLKNEIPDAAKKTIADSASIKTVPPLKPAITYADNNRIWKKFVDEQTKLINAEVLPNKKIKKGDYTVTLEYEIGTDGTVTTKNIICDPKNEILVDYIRDQMMANPPQLAPQIVNGVPKKSSKRQVLIFLKEKN